MWKKKPEPTFPPPSWDTSKPADADTAVAAKVPLPETPAHERESHLKAPGKGSTTTAISDAAPVEGDFVEDAPNGATATSTLAERIRDLIPSKLFDGTAQLIPPPPHAPDAPPPPQEPPAWLDTQLARLLESAEIMNGTISKGRKSVWDTLERLRAPPTANSASSTDEKGKGKAASREEDPDSDSDDDSSVMLYAPLVPSNDSKLELAEREIVKTDAEGRIVGVIREEPAQPVLEAEGKSAESQGEGANVNRRKSWWPFKKQATEQPVAEPSTPSKDTSAETTVESAEAPHKETFAEGLKRRISRKAQPILQASANTSKESVVEGLKRRVSQKLHERAVWVPSATKISFQATWWGYRMYVHIVIHRGILP
jgi:hypothetical protein